MPASTTSKGYSQGWTVGEPGWGDLMSENIRRLDGDVNNQWAPMVTTTGLTYAYRGGVVSFVDEAGATTLSRVADGTIALAPSTVNYVERDRLGNVTKNTTGFSEDKMPMARVTTGLSAISSIEDWRGLVDRSARGDNAFRDVYVARNFRAADISLLDTSADVPTGKAGITSKGSAGTLALVSNAGKRIEFWADNTQRWLIEPDGTFTPAVDASYDIGRSGAVRPRDLYISRDYRGRYVILSENAASAPAMILATNVNGAGGVMIEAVAGSVDGALTVSSAVPGTYVGSRSNDLVCFMTGGTGRWQVSAPGNFLAIVDNVYDFGAAAAGRPRDLYVARDIYSGRDVSVGRNITANAVGAIGTFYDLNILHTSALKAASADSLVVAKVASQGIVALGNLGATPAIDLSLSNTYKGTLTANATPTFSNPVLGAWYTLFLTQDATGGRTVTWPGGVIWGSAGAPFLTPTPGKRDVISLYWDGTNYWGFIGAQGF